jgi:multiple sugar transport system ATP-binding protein
MAQIEVQNIEKHFRKGIPVLQDVSFRVADHSFFTLLGPSGCGKSTLLKIIAGLEFPDQGSVAIAGRDVTRLPPPKRNIAMVFQSYALYPHLTVFKNIATPLKLRKVPEAEIRRRVKETAELLQITDHLEKKPGPLSGGERQRVALARALVREPDVFLMDEPLSNLDALLREKTRVELKMLFSRLGATVIYVTHDQVEAMAMSDVVAVMNEGRIQQAGPPSEIYRNPASEFVAGFVGSPRMNFFPVELLHGNIRFSNGRMIDIPGPFHSIAKLPEEMTLGFRPEDARLEGPGIKFSGEVQTVEELGSQAVAFVKIAEGEAKIILQAHGRNAGGRLDFFVPEDTIHLFHKKDGTALAQESRQS